MTSKRSFLFLQGVCSPFFSALGNALRQRGHRVIKLNFNVGDQLFWHGKPSYHWRKGPGEQLTDYVSTLWDKHEITDQILFGDRRAVHIDLVNAARQRGIVNHVFEEGYLRPYWITLEREGVNAHSMLPRNPEWFREVAEHLPEQWKPSKIKSSFKIRAWHDVKYHLGGVLNPVLYPGYRTHAALNAPQEYMGYLWRFTRMNSYKKRDTASIQTLWSSRRPYYLLPLQLNGDFQVRHHSSFNDMNELMTFVAETFALHAPKDAILVIKNHPLDMGMTPHARDVKRITERYGLKDRVVYLETGNLEKLVKYSRGLITLNSTSGHVSLAALKPTIALANAIYDMPGLTHQGPLESFWYQPQAPDPATLDAFRRVLTHSVQINGGFYTSDAIELAVKNAIPLIEAEQSPLEQLLCRTPAGLCAIS
ncbi:capsule biosynthesis protein [Carnimonas bestiolae]|uniref:capsule biosynthesis protein n=1 Tax=Carnimonas bestiolae TaxID=3402172 RepID=UPI003EDB8B19